MKNENVMPPKNYEAVVNLISEIYPNLSKVNKQIARFINQNPNAVALESIIAIAAKCEVHASSLVRFSQSIGYTGFKELQSVFQTRLATSAPGFNERISALEAELSKRTGGGSAALLRDIVVQDMAHLQELLDTVTETMLTEAAQLLAEAGTIYIAGQLRSEPVSILLRYLLTMLKRKVILLDPSGGLAQEMARAMEPGDCLIAIAFRHYAKEVVNIYDMVSQRGIPTIAITDSQLSPLAKNTKVLFTIPEDEYSFSRSLAAPMCLVQAIATSTAAALRPGAENKHKIPTVTEIALDENARVDL